MAIDLNNELLSKLRRAKVDEIEGILAEAGQKASEGEIKRIKFELERLTEHDGETLSLDELDAVAGGAWYYDYEEDGCFATVEYGSDCMGNDGGCDYFFNHYYKFSQPVNVKCSCGRYMFKDYVKVLPEGNIGYLKCPYCQSVLEIPENVWDALEPG